MGYAGQVSNGFVGDAIKTRGAVFSNTVSDGVADLLDGDQLGFLVTVRRREKVGYYLIHFFQVS